MIPLPNQIAPFVNKLGRLLSPWNLYLQQFTQAPPDMVPVIVVGSPFSYTAKEPGSVSIIGASGATLTRGQIVINVSNQRLVPVAVEDTITVTGVPTMMFLPSYGQNTGG